MAPAGRRAFAARTPERTGVYSFERNEAARFPSEQAKKLRANRAAAAFFDAQPPWYRRTATHWVISAKREATRERRLDQLIADSAKGSTIGPLTRPPGKKLAVEPRARMALTPPLTPPSASHNE
jgi:Bacteriocin-protection, YdeI or OmpD-Associated